MIGRHVGLLLAVLLVVPSGCDSDDGAKSGGDVAKDTKEQATEEGKGGSGKKDPGKEEHTSDPQNGQNYVL